MKVNRLHLSDGDLVILSGGSSWTVKKIQSWIQNWADARGFHNVSFEMHENSELKETSITVISGIGLDEAFERDVLNENG